MASDPLKIGVIGYGYWGPNIVRNFTSHADTHVIRVADQSPERRGAIGGTYPWIRIATDAQEVIDDPEVDAIAVVTPMFSHHGLAKAALQAGKHVLVEKPLATSVADCDDLGAIAQDKGLTLMVDHTFVYTGAVRKIRDYIAKGELGDIHYFDSVRINLGLFQPDYNVLWDLAPHDISILDYVLGLQPRWVSAIGARHYGKVENLAYLTVGFDGEMLAHFHSNWTAPVKTRRITIAGSQRMLVYDDTEPSEKIKLYESGVTVSDLGREAKYELLVQYRTGDVIAPKLDGTEALRRVVAEFASAIRQARPPTTDVMAGRRVVEILAAADESLKRGGQRVTL